MSLDPESVPQQNFGSLLGCLVEGDPQQRIRERRVRRKALITSVLSQGSLLALVILAPLFAKPERLLTTIATPSPAYRHVSGQPHATQTPHATLRRVCVTCPTARPASLNANNRVTTSNLEQPQDIGADGIAAIPCVNSGCIDIGRTEGPKPPPGSESRQEKPRIIHETQISPAMLTRRVEPVYPTLARQVGRAGRVELRAVIATDGTIQSLRIVSGDPLFYQSALEAVRQWRYRPTVLNGEPVEIDTFITVIYNIDR